MAHWSIRTVQALCCVDHLSWEELKLLQHQSLDAGKLHSSRQQFPRHHRNLFLTIVPWAVVLEGFQGQQHPHQYVLDSSADLAMAGQDKDMVESLL